MSESSEAMRRELEQMSSEELISILRNRDAEEWQPEAFEVVAAVLKARGVPLEDVAALGPEGVDEVDSQPLVTIGRFFSPAEAHIARMALEEAEIPAWVADESGGTMYGVGIGARVRVRVEDEEAARQILSAAPATGDALPPDLAEPPCPKCGSRAVTPESRREEHEEQRRWYYVCGDCGETWAAS